MPSLDLDALLTTQEVAALLHVGLRTVHRLTARGELPSLTVGRLRRYRRGAVLEWLAMRETREGARLAPLVRLACPRCGRVTVDPQALPAGTMVRCAGCGGIAADRDWRRVGAAGAPGR